MERLPRATEVAVEKLVLSVHQDQLFNAFLYCLDKKINPFLTGFFDTDKAPHLWLESYLDRFSDALERAEHIAFLRPARSNRERDIYLVSSQVEDILTLRITPALNLSWRETKPCKVVRLLAQYK